ncbi:MAG: sigma-54-dependent Fis family transcriptional regulator [Rhodobacteraceae bacterium]|nr:MAG: sigma-54-dependent Fis family transcriptional regulator [Paracoccaceae bacterium]|tara:strand:- start:923 stop:2293 length:1371 start_codon:yes stop_codon:yes gene_type:complete
MSYILVVDDEKDIRELIGEILVDDGHEVRLAENSEEAINFINKTPPQLLILDIWLKDSKMDGIEILKSVKQNNPTVPVVIISGHGNIKIAVAAVKQGAYDFIEKPFNIDQLLLIKNRALEAHKLRNELILMRKKEFLGYNMVGKSTAFKLLLSNLDKVTRSNGRVMLRGPAGSGKEIAARYIYLNSNRVGGPFISISCASIESDRMEEVLFGKEENGVIKPGLLEQADNGVLFFDEVADMPKGTQSKILRVLIEQVFTRVGGDSKVRVDLRVVSSTTKDLSKEIINGNFREELYHRLNVVPITLPSLEERREDVEILAQNFVSSFNKSEGLPFRVLSKEAIAKLQTLSWPGNIRQLKNTIERALILGPLSGEIEPSEILHTELADKGDDKDSENIKFDFVQLPLREAREVFERDYLITQIRRFSGNISRTAQFVGMERSALHRKIKTLDISSDHRE